jgi:hypothetical protein
MLATPGVHACHNCISNLPLRVPQVREIPSEPILRPNLNLQLQRQRCTRLERFYKVEENIFVFKTRYVGYS